MLMIHHQEGDRWRGQAGAAGATTDMSARTRRTLVRPPTAHADELPSSQLGRSMTVTGVLESDGEVHVHGHVLGRIDADRVVVESGGYVEGDVVGRDVRIQGRLIGRVFAFNVTVDESADICGRIFHHTVTVARGARIDARMPWRPVNFFESLDQLPETQA